MLPRRLLRLTFLAYCASVLTAILLVLQELLEHVEQTHSRSGVAPVLPGPWPSASPGATPELFRPPAPSEVSGRWTPTSGEPTEVDLSLLGLTQPPSSLKTASPTEATSTEAGSPGAALRCKTTWSYPNGNVGVCDLPFGHRDAHWDGHQGWSCG